MGSAYSAGAERGCGEGQHLNHLHSTKPMWERACSRRGRQIQHKCWLTHRYREQARSHRD
ncbi:hypothetical protein C1X65_05525 [Pseudomonas sp. FW305-70]|nr:hypothetical protein C1X65_05525 [Pseudomonas sp. FW305-70]